MRTAKINLKLKKDFPLFRRYPKLVYLDNASTTQKPQSVLKAEHDFYTTANANVHRGIYRLSRQATAAYEGARERVAEFINAKRAAEIIFTRNATEALNLIAAIEGSRLKRGDEILISAAEHHSNILPWQRVAKERGAKLVWVELDSDYRLSEKEFTKKLSKRTKIVALADTSNVLGYVAPSATLAAQAQAVGARIVIDAAQSMGHRRLDVQALGADYVVASGHKMYGPTGIGFLYARSPILDDAPPFLVGGHTILQVSRQAVVWDDPPARYEAGTPNIAGAIGLAAAMQYLTKLGWPAIEQYERALTDYALQRLAAIDGATIFGPATSEERVPVFSFTLQVGKKQAHSHDVAEIADTDNLALRGGHHCAQPLMAALGVKELTRASCGIYNTAEDIDRLVAALNKVKRVLS